MISNNQRGENTDVLAEITLELGAGLSGFLRICLSDRDLKGQNTAYWITGPYGEFLNRCSAIFFKLMVIMFILMWCSDVLVGLGQPLLIIFLQF